MSEKIAALINTGQTFANTYRSLPGKSIINIYGFSIISFGYNCVRMLLFAMALVSAGLLLYKIESVRALTTAYL